MHFLFLMSFIYCGPLLEAHVEIRRQISEVCSLLPLVGTRVELWSLLGLVPSVFTRRAILPALNALPT